MIKTGREKKTKKLDLSKKKLTNFFYHESERPWFFKKNGDVGYVYTKPVYIQSKRKMKKTKKFVGSLQNIGFDMNKSSKKARDLKLNSI